MRTAEFKTLLPDIKNRRCGTPDQVESYLERLKKDIANACDHNFWGNPNKPWRPKTDPGKNSFGHFNFGRGT